MFSANVNKTLIDRVARWTLLPLTAVLIGIAVLGSRLGTLPNTLCPAFWMILLAVLLSRPKIHWMSHVARSKGLVWLGKYSYGMYVVQLPLASLMTAGMVTGLLSKLSIDPLISNIAYIPLMFGVTMLLGFASYHALEKHFLQLKPKWS
jgi:peptidoglycan/LPS O-acetylase OafA/YrhL